MIKFSNQNIYSKSFLDGLEKTEKLESFSSRIAKNRDEDYIDENGQKQTIMSSTVI